MKRALAGALALLVVLAIAAAVIYRRELDRLQFSARLFSGAEQYENFNRMDELYPVARMSPATSPGSFPDGEPIALPRSFRFQDREVTTEAFLAETDTSAVLVLHDGAVRFERYLLTGGRDVTWLSMSVAKSFISALLGIAVEEGRLDIAEPVTAYVPELAGSAYDGVRIKDILQMSSGAGWNEDYSDPDSDIGRLGRILAVGGSLDEFVTTLSREREPGTYNLYNSADTQVLGLLLARVVERPIADYMQEKLWHPLGAEHEAFWMVDDEGRALAFCGLNATARDYARLGELYRNQGRVDGRQIVPEAWVRASTTPDAPHLMPGYDNPLSDFNLGYGYQWWIPEGDEGEYTAIGVYNQFIYVNPARSLVIVKLSAYSDYAISLEESAYRENETIEFFRAIGSSLD